MNKPPLIGLCSPTMGSGKTTVASYLEALYEFEVVRLAAPLKGMIQALLIHAGYSKSEADNIITDRFLKEAPLDLLNGKSPRHAMQTLGTEWGRNCIGENFWTDVALNRALQLNANSRPVVIDDVRFPNEADAIVNAGGIMFKIVRPDASVTVSHASEGALDAYPVNGYIINDGSFDGLYAQVQNQILAPMFPSLV